MLHVEVKVLDCSRDGAEIASLCGNGRLRMGLKQYLKDCGPQSYGMKLALADPGVLSMLAEKSCSKRLRELFERLARQASLRSGDRFCLNVLGGRLMQITVWR